MEPSYRHTQPNWLFRTYLALACLLLLISPFLIEDRRMLAMAGGVNLLLFANLFPYCSLTIRIDHEKVVARYFGGIAGRKVHLADILEIETVRLPWYTDWWYGILWIWGRTEIIVDGYDAVVLTLPEGRSVTLGTDEPEALHRALQEAMKPFA